MPVIFKRGMAPAPRRLFLAMLPLAFVVVVAGAFVRLKDAGLGCPDWPGCYGQLAGVASEQTAAARYPQSPYDAAKAWIEVSHRYIAAVLGLLILFAAVADWRARRRFALPQWLLLLVAAQALLGMLTVTQKLMPAVVVLHLGGGMLIVALIAAAVARPPAAARRRPPAAGKALWRVAALALAAQILLGGWVSANYAGIACPEFPACAGGWLPAKMDFSVYNPMRQLHEGADGGAISAAALQTAHWLHRVGALFAALAAAALLWALWRAGRGGMAAGFAALFALQVVIGIGNVALQLPLLWALAHNAVACALVIKMAFLRVQFHSTVAAPAGGGAKP